MKHTHTLFRAISLAIGLALLVVTGTAAMIAAFSGPASAPRAYGVYGTYAEQPVLLALLPETAQAPSMDGDDNVLYQRVTRADGTQVWELTPAAQTTLAQENRSSPAMAMRYTADASGFSRVSYSLQGKPGGFSKTLKSCNSAVTGTSSKPETRPAYDAYDLSCSTMG